MKKVMIIVGSVLVAAATAFAIYWLSDDSESNYEL